MEVFFAIHRRRGASLHCTIAERRRQINNRSVITKSGSHHSQGNSPSSIPENLSSIIQAVWSLQCVAGQRFNCGLARLTQPFKGSVNHAQIYRLREGVDEREGIGRVVPYSGSPLERMVTLHLYQSDG